MILQLAPRPGLRVAGRATAWPGDLAGVERAERSNPAAYAELLGDGWEAELERRGWSAEHPRAAWGVERRQWARGLGLDAFDLALLASKRALEAAGLAPRELALVCAATATPPDVTKGFATRLAVALGTDALGLDVRAGGAGGLAAWCTAAGYHGASCRASLVVAAEAPSLFMNPADLGNALLYGDGAAALVLVSEEGASAGLVGGVAGSARAEGQPFTVPGTLPPTEAALRAGRYAFQAPDAAYRESLSGIRARALDELRARFPEECARLAHYAPYAVTRAQVEADAARLGSPAGAALELLARRGCVGCASPLAVFCALEPRPGELIALSAAAGGVSWNGMIWRS